MQKTADCGMFRPIVYSDQRACVSIVQTERYNCHYLAKTWRVMKLTILFLTAALMHTYASGVAQNVTLSGRDLPLREIFTVIEKQTGYVTIANEGVFVGTKTVSTTASNMPLREFLNEILKDQPIKYIIQDRTIFLSRKVAPEVWKQIAEMAELGEDNRSDIRGRVLDSLGNPLSDATITNRNTKESVRSAADGSFSIKAEAGDVLLISFVGHETRTISVTTAMVSGQSLVVSLRPSVSRLDEIEVSVSTGYQRIRPEHSTGAVSRIATKEYESRVSSNFLDGLVNRLPGLMINNDITFNSNIGGNSSSNTLFNIRGISTMTGNQSPLIVVDGYPTELSLDMINPNEIESVTILKDAAAATVYGVRASNGVIVVERKRAVAGKPRFNFRATTEIRPKEDYTRYRWDDEASDINIALNREIYKNSINANTWNQLNNPRGTAYVPVYYIMAQEKANIITPYQAEQKYSELSEFDNTADYGDLFLRNAVTQTNNFNVSGGNRGALYYFTANYTANRLQKINNKNGRFLLSGRTNLELTKRLSLELTTDYQEGTSRLAPVPDITSIYPYERFRDAGGAPMAVFNQSRINPFYNEVIQARGLQDHLYYPLVDVNEISDRNKTVNNKLFAQFSYNLGKGFNLRFGGIYENSRTDMKHYATELSSQARQYVNSYATLDGSGNLVYNVPKGGFLQQRYASTKSTTVRVQLNYDKRIHSDHTLNGIIGAEVRDVIDQLSSAAYFGYNDDNLLQQPVNYGTITTGFQSPFFTTSSLNYNQLFSQEYGNDRALSGYSNIVYSYKSTYSLSGSIRVDQSNLFGTDPRYRYKPLWSVGAAWNIHNESFMKDLTWVRKMKLRVADGFNGNVAKMSLPQVIARNVTNQYTNPVSTALTRYSFANSSLRWEQTRNTNVGLDMDLFNGVRATVEFYTKKSTDLLATAQIDPTIGPGPTWINTASIRNRGLELNLNADWISKNNFNWNTGLVLSKNNSKVLKVYQDLAFAPENLNGAGYVENYPVGSLFAYRWAGLNEEGVPQVMDAKGTVYSSRASDIATILTNESLGTVRYMGSSLPTITGGFSNRFDIGNFYVFCMIRYYGGFKVLAPRPNPNTTRPLEGAGNYWKQPGDEQQTDVMGLAWYSAYSSRVYNYSDSYVVNGDYLTLGDLTAAYNFARFPAIRKAGFSLFELKLQVANLYTIGLNKYNYSMATGDFAKTYLTPTYTFALFTNF